MVASNLPLMTDPKFTKIGPMRTLVLLALVLGTLSNGPARAEGGTFNEFTYTGTTGARHFWLYVPAGTPHPRPLVVFLHGCLQSALQAKDSTKFNALADQRDFVVAYPQQNVTTGSSAPLVDGNGTGCWNWFLPADQARDAGEPAIIAGITRFVMEREAIDPARVFLEGLSAGADMAVIMGANYPDLYAAVGAVAGCAFATCSDGTGALAYAAMGPRARVVPMFVEQGTADTLNAYALGRGLVHSWLGTSDFADDGRLDGSIARTPAVVSEQGFDQTPSPGSGDICVRNNNWPCLGGALGLSAYPVTIERYADGQRCDVLDFWSIHGLEHAYPHAQGVFTDPLGPDITIAAWDFFAAHPRGSCAPVT